MSWIVELIIDLLVDGAIEGTMSKKMPKPLRIGLFLFLLVLYVTMIGIFIYVAFVSKNLLFQIILSVVSLLLFIYLCKMGNTLRKLNKNEVTDQKDCL